MSIKTPGREKKPRLNIYPVNTRKYNKNNIYLTHVPVYAKYIGSDRNEQVPIRDMINDKYFRRCPICRNKSVSLFLPATSPPPESPIQIQVTEKYFGLHGDIVQCKSCGFLYVGKNLYVEKVTSLYKKMDDLSYIQEEKERRLSFIRILKTIGKLKNVKKGKLLDIGCCTGALLAEAKKLGWKVYGIDPSVWACKMAFELHHLKISNATVQSYKASKKKFEAIVLIDVFEHVNDPFSVLKKVNRLLSKNGILCLVTPDYGSIVSKLLGERWWGIRLAHLSYFRDLDLTRLFEKTGFKIIITKTYVRYFSLYYILVRLLPLIENKNMLKSLLKRITVPLVFFDTFELYLCKNKDL